MISIKSISLLLTVLLFSYPSFGSRELMERGNLCSKSGLTQKNVSYYLTFKGERRDSSEVLGFNKNTFFVGTHFVVNRVSSSFSNETLLNAKGIGKISDSRIEEFKVVDSLESEAYFSSTKKLPLGFKLKCDNSLKVRGWSEFVLGEEGKKLFRALSRKGCFKGGLPFIVSDQRVYSCNDYFSQSRVISFYFKEDDSKTRVLTYTFSELVDSFGFIQKRVMAGEVRRSLKKIPSIIENLL